MKMTGPFLALGCTLKSEAKVLNEHCHVNFHWPVASRLWSSWIMDLGVNKTWPALLEKGWAGQSSFHFRCPVALQVQSHTQCGSQERGTPLGGRDKGKPCFWHPSPLARAEAKAFCLKYSGIFILWPKQGWPSRLENRGKTKKQTNNPSFLSLYPKTAWLFSVLSLL